MKKYYLFAIVIVLGAIIAGYVDDAIGIEFSVPFWAKMVHGVMYLLWGCAIASVLGREE